MRFWLLVTAAFLGIPVLLQAQTAAEIVDRVDQLLRGQSSEASVRMEVVTEHWSRSIDMHIWSLGTDYSLIRIDAPPKDAGTATLKAQTELWNYLPRVDRTIKACGVTRIGCPSRVRSPRASTAGGDISWIGCRWTS